MEEFFDFVKLGLFQRKHYESREEYLSDTAKMLLQKGMVKEGFEAVIRKREEEYPTGILTVTIPVSIPHAEFEFVNQESIVVTVFEEPVSFRRMDAPDQEIGAKVSFMLLLKDAHKHMAVLQQLAFLMQSQALRRVQDANSMEEFEAQLREVGR